MTEHEIDEFEEEGESLARKAALGAAASAAAAGAAAVAKSYVQRSHGDDRDSATFHAPAASTAKAAAA